MDGLPILGILNKLKKHNTFVLLETIKTDKDNFLSYLFVNPTDIVQSHSLSNIKDCFERVSSYLNRGYYAAGFCSYEMGYAFEKMYKKKKSYDFPLLWFGIFKKPVIFDHQSGEFIANRPGFGAGGEDTGSYTIKRLKLNATERDYHSCVSRIKRLIEQGDTYQVNYTMKYKFDFRGCPYQLYYELRNNQSASYCAFIKTRGFSALSFSPELFFRKKGRHIEVKPMKGTAGRGSNLKEDRKNSSVLRNDRKNRAENIMIVDLLRNDLGRISEIGSVRVSSKFSIEKYETLFQMTSTIKSIIKKDMSFYQLFKSIFPSGSVTGAPKIRTMQIINDIEKEQRRLYTGSVGLIMPNQDAVFNVAIRTILLRHQKGEMGVGSGIVYPSIASGEYQESKLKGSFLTHRKQAFQLIETMLWSKKTGFFLLRRHLNRLKESARYFGFSYNERNIREFLKKKRRRLEDCYRYKIRLLLFRDGHVSIFRRRINKKINHGPAPVVISDKLARSSDVFLRHKTTNRKLYDQEYRNFKRLGYFDVIFQNEKQEITEGAISNIFIKSNGIYYTPSLDSGLLNGVYRQYLIDGKLGCVREKKLSLNDIRNASKIYLTNSVRGMVEVRLSKKKGASS